MTTVFDCWNELLAGVGNEKLMAGMIVSTVSILMLLLFAFPTMSRQVIFQRNCWLAILVRMKVLAEPLCGVVLVWLTAPLTLKEQLLSLRLSHAW